MNVNLQTCVKTAIHLLTIRARVRLSCTGFGQGWHVPELAKGVVSRSTTPFASSGTCHPPRNYPQVILTRTLAAIVATSLLGVGAVQAADPAATKDRMVWFRDAKFGMFMHWGIYCVPAGEWKGKTNYAEWFQLQTQMPCSQYDGFAAQFNPVKFNASQWRRPPRTPA